MKQRIELNMHSNYSRMNGINSAREIIDRAAELGMNTIAITDIGSVKGLPRAYDYIKMHSKNMKLILGMEAYYQDGKIYCESENEEDFGRMILLVKNEVGRKNLYKLISAYYKNGYAELTTREGLLIGTSDHYLKALGTGESDASITKALKIYDFLLVSPFGDKEYIKRLISLAEENGILVIASNSPYYLQQEEAIGRAVLRFADKKQTNLSEDLSFMTTDDMMNAFDYLGDKAEDIVINNGHKLVDMIEDDISPIPQGYFLPDTDGMFEEVKNRAVSKAADLYKINVTHYGYDLPEPINERLTKELGFLSKYKGHVLPFWIAMKVADDSKAKGYPVTSRGAASSSFIAYLLGLTQVNPLKPHYRCTQCNHTEFVEMYESGFDLPAKTCPHCGKALLRDGHNVPSETMFSIDGNKEPDIDLNLCSEYRLQAIDFSKTLFKNCKSVYGSVVSSFIEITAKALVNQYFKDSVEYTQEDKERIAGMCCGAFRKTGLIVPNILYTPEGYEIEDFTPVEYIEDYEGKLVPVTHFDSRNDLYYTLFSFDIIVHSSNDMLKLLKEKTGVEPTENDIADNADILKAIWKGNTASIPEMCTEYVRKTIEHTKPEKFSDYVAISGLVHGTDVYEDNAKDLFAKGICDFGNVIDCRENILLFLDKKRKEYAAKTGKDAPLNYLDCYKISEIVRKGRAKRDLPEYESALGEIGIPDWYIESAKKIRYLFPKAHAVEYMIVAFKLLWYKLHFTKEFEETVQEIEKAYEEENQ